MSEIHLLSDSFREVLHQVHCHSLNYFKAVLTKLFWFCQSFLSIRHNHLNLSSGLQAHSDHIRKAGEEKNLNHASHEKDNLVLKFSTKQKLEPRPLAFWFHIEWFLVV